MFPFKTMEGFLLHFVHKYICIKIWFLQLYVISVWTVRNFNFKVKCHEYEEEKN